jgi:hypothetical protein
MAASNESRGGDHRGSVRDPENDGRLKENREAGRTKGTTEGSRERAHGHERENEGRSGGHEGGSRSHGQSHSQSRDDDHSRSHGQSHSQGRDDDRSRSQGQSHGGSRSGRHGDDNREEEQSLKEREYRDKDGNVHHHTRTYMEDHGKVGDENQNRGRK